MSEPGMTSRASRATLCRHAAIPISGIERAVGRRRMRCTRLRRVTEILPAADADAARWLLLPDVDWWDLVRYGPPGFDVYVRIAFPHDSETDVVYPSGECAVDAVRAALATLASCTTTPDRGMRRSGRAGRAGRRLLKRREWRSLIERCCFSPALSKHSETHQLWLGTALQRASHKNRSSSGRRIKPGALPARSTRRSSHCRLFRQRVPSSGLRPAGRCWPSALRGTGSVLPRPGLATASAHRQILKLKRL